MEAAEPVPQDLAPTAEETREGAPELATDRQPRPDMEIQPKDRGPHPITVVGIPAGGMSELGEQARLALVQADIIFGSWRQLHLLSPDISAERQPWPSPLVPGITNMLQQHRGRTIVVLASGDPLFHGIASTLRRLLPDVTLHIIPAASSASFACARLGWAGQDTPVHSLVTSTVAGLGRMIDVAERFLILARDETSLPEIVDYLAQHGQDGAQLTVLHDLGSVDELIVTGSVSNPPSVSSALYIVAVELAASQRYRYSTVPGLPDTAYAHDGQITKRKIRALTLSALAPRPGEILWDVGGGAGSIAIEWLRAVATTKAVVFERDELRCQRIMDNARDLGVADRLAILHAAPDAYFEVPDAPNAIFIGGGLTIPAVFAEAFERLQPGGRLVANAVTLETQQVLWQLRQAHGGHLSELRIAHEHQVGSFHSLRPALPIVQWEVTKPIQGTDTL
ncbi:MAG: precorrin-6y C5,15-methyltransferase (decarboxylating) subunit CbiE [Corynebacterium sp.]|nr:precorrin-6y C5,15-methyltransferase (decarboxylating) subunit CbiE [Corynebacterium sp.]